MDSLGKFLLLKTSKLSSKIVDYLLVRSMKLINQRKLKYEAVCNYTFHEYLGCKKSEIKYFHYGSGENEMIVVKRLINGQYMTVARALPARGYREMKCEKGKGIQEEAREYLKRSEIINSII